jgi:hypothetical protein
MKERDKQNSDISSKLHMIYVSSNNDRHPVTKTFTPLQYTSLFLSTLSFGLNPIKFPTAPFHLTSLHFTSLHITVRLEDFCHSSIPFSPSLWLFFLTLSKHFRLTWKVSNARSWFQILMALFTKEYFPISILCFLALIFRTWSTLLK